MSAPVEVVTETVTRPFYDCSACDQSFYDAEVDTETYPDGHVEEYFRCPSCKDTVWREVADAAAEDRAVESWKELDR